MLLLMYNRKNYILILKAFEELLLILNLRIIMYVLYPNIVLNYLFVYNVILFIIINLLNIILNITTT